jgi:hypothetical protein
LGRGGWPQHKAARQREREKAQGGTAEREREGGNRALALGACSLIEITLDRSHSVCPSVERVKPVTKERSTWGDHQFVSS